MKLSLATNWDSNLLSRITKLNSQERGKVSEFFGSLPVSVFGHCRQACGTPNISKESAEERIRDIKKNGIGFNYLLNSSVSPYLDTEEKINKAKSYISWIIEQKADIITIGNEQTLDFVYSNFPEIPINISIVMSIKSHDEAERLIRTYPSIKRITPHQSINRDKNELASIINISHEHGVEVELLANEICVYLCPKMKDHYIFMSKSTQNKNALDFRPIRWCKQIDVGNISAFLNACWIRPEDTELYEKMGVDILKISGRGESTDYLSGTAAAYSEKRHDGNVLDLFYQSRWSKGEIPYYDNRKLDGFILYLWENGWKKTDRVPEKYNPSMHPNSSQFYFM